MSYRLHPALIDDLGLVAALQTECERMSRYTHATIVQRIDKIQEKIPDDQALCLYRIAQESINNAIKHADAGIIELMLTLERQSLVLTVRDNGKGFDPAGSSVHTGLGLSSMCERAQLAGGSWEIRSQPGRGTTVSAIVPVQGVAK